MAKLTLDDFEVLKRKVGGHCLDDLNYSYYVELTREGERMARITLGDLEVLKRRFNGHGLMVLTHSDFDKLVETVEYYERKGERMASDNSVSEHFILEFKEEASRQRIVFAKHDANKTPTEWFWLIGLLAGKALKAHLSGNKEAAKCNMIATVAACYNWYVAVCSE